MLVIRTAQMQVFRDRKLDAYVRQLAHHLRSRYTNLQERDDILYEHISTAIDMAAQYAIRNSDDVRRFIECCVRFGWDFDRRQDTCWAVEILKMDNYDGTTKLDKIEDYELYVLKGLVGGGSCHHD